MQFLIRGKIGYGNTFIVNLKAIAQFLINNPHLFYRDHTVILFFLHNCSLYRLIAPIIFFQTIFLLLLAIGESE